MTKNLLLIVISPTDYSRYERQLFNLCNDIDRKYLCYHDICEYIPQENHLCDECQFILIDQRQALDQITALLERINRMDKRILVWTHQSEVYPGFGPVRKEFIRSVIDAEKLLECNEFSHNRSEAEGLMHYYHEKNIPEVKKIIDKYLLLEISANTSSLRCEVLNPLVALDLLTQAGNDHNANKQLMQEIDHILGSEDYKNKYKILCQNLFQVSDYKVGGANISTIISQAQISNTIDHMILKDFADALEARIAELEG